MIVFASDLDQTLIYSEKALNKLNKLNKLNNEIGQAKFIPIEFLEGKEISFITGGTLQGLKEISTKAIFIPSTTRTVEQFRRICFSQHDIYFKYAIVSNGGNIIVDGKVDDEWNESIRKEISTECAPAEEIVRKVEELNSEAEFIISAREADGLFRYFIVKTEELTLEKLKILSDYAGELNWNMSFQGRKLYFIPKFLDKARALGEILKREGIKGEVFASGDSNLDVQLLLAADCGIVPGHADIVTSTSLKESSNICVSEQKGGLASEEIVGNIISRIKADTTMVRGV